MIILPGGAHQPIPKSEVQTIVALKILMVLVVVNGSIEPFAQPVAVGTLGKELKAQMAVHIIDGHKHQKHHDVHKVDGDGKGKYIDDARLYHCFRRAEGKRGPRRWVGAFVVQQVKEFKQLGMVHEAVRKIKIRIVHEQHYRKDEDIVSSTVLAKCVVKSGVWLNSRVVEHQRHHCKNNKSDKGINHFAAVIAALGPTFLYFFKKGFAFVPYIKNQKSQARQYNISYCRKQQYKYHLP